MMQIFFETPHAKYSVERYNTITVLVRITFCRISLSKNFGDLETRLLDEGDRLYRCLVYKKKFTPYEEQNPIYRTDWKGFTFRAMV